jgi:multidrug efflux pump subunit AcrB
LDLLSAFRRGALSFVPLAEAVMFAVGASYLLSRTLVPTFIMWFERNNHKVARTTPSNGGSSEDHSADGAIPPGKSVAFWARPLVRFQQLFEREFDRLRTGYHRLLGTLLTRRVVFAWSKSSRPNDSAGQ